MKIVSFGQIPDTPVSHNPNIFKQVIAKKGDIPHIVQVARITLKPGDGVPSHAHSDLYELVYVEAGQGMVVINGNEQAINSGDVLTIEPTETHEFANTSNQELTMFYFGVESS